MATLRRLSGAGPNVPFTNDYYSKVRGDWKLMETKVMQGAAIGANSVVLLRALTICRNSLIGAGCVVSKDVLDNAIVIRNPGKVTGFRQ